MKTPLVLLNLLHQPVRTVVAILGVAFAILLVFMQLGFYGSAENAATSLYRALDYDIVITSGNYLNINRARSFPRLRIYQALEHQDVASVAPLYVNWQTWRILDGTNQRRSILVVAFDLDEPVLRSERVFHSEPAEDCLRGLRTPFTVLMDTSTRDYFGPRSPGVETELGWRTVQVVGQFTIGTGYGADGMLITSDGTYAGLYGPAALEQVTLGLIKLKPEARGRAAEVKEDLIGNLYNTQPRDEVRIYTRDEIERREQSYWMGRTSVGVIFEMGVIVACIVGTIFVYQVIATDIANHFAEYATLKAIGYRESYLSGVVLRQAFALSVLGYVPGLLVALALYALGKEKANIPLSMTWGRAGGVLLLSIAMCSVSGFLALRKVKSADPADLF
jgi:putative ABC transport system permease protein